MVSFGWVPHPFPLQSRAHSFQFLILTHSGPWVCFGVANSQIGSEDLWEFYCSNQGASNPLSLLASSPQSTAKFKDNVSSHIHCLPLPPLIPLFRRLGQAEGNSQDQTSRSGVHLPSWILLYPTLSMYFLLYQLSYLPLDIQKVDKEIYKVPVFLWLFCIDFKFDPNILCTSE
jgi:hypothetical protein